MLSYTFNIGGEMQKSMGESIFCHGMQNKLLKKWIIRVIFILD